MIFSINKSNFINLIDMITLFGAVFFIMTMILLVVITKKLKNKRKKIIGGWILTWLTAAIIMFSCGVFGRFVDVNTINTKTYTKKELVQDLKQIEKCIMKENPLYFADKDELQELFTATYKKVEDGMTELEFYRLINPIVAAVRCGHTNLSISQALLENRKDTAKFFPLKVTLADNRLFLLEEDVVSGISAGDEIKSINGKTSDEIVNILIRNISGDSYHESKQRYIISKHFNSRFYDFVDNSDKFQVIIMDKKGSLKSADLNAKYREEFNTTAWELHFAEYKNNNYYDSKIYENYAVLTINIFMQEKGEKFNVFLDEFFLKLKEKKISKLIIDLRGNYGGDSFMAKDLLSHLITEKIEYFNCDLPLIYSVAGFKKLVSPVETTFRGDVVVLTDGAGFSTTAHLCALMKYHKLGTFVGSETGGTYVCTDGSKDVNLNHTRIRLHYSTLPFKVAVEGLVEDKGIKPDISISPTIKDILNNRDVSMEQGLQALGIRE